MAVNRRGRWINTFTPSTCLFLRGYLSCHLSCWFRLPFGLQQIFFFKFNVPNNKNVSKLTAPGLATSSFSEFGDSSLTDTLLESLAGALGVDDVGVVGRGGGDWMMLSLLRVCRSEGDLPTGSGFILLVDRRCLKRQAPHSLLLLLPLSFCWSSVALSLELDITGVVLGVGWALVLSLLLGQQNMFRTKWSFFCLITQNKGLDNSNKTCVNQMWTSTLIIKSSIEREHNLPIPSVGFSNGSQSEKIRLNRGVKTDIIRASSLSAMKSSK